MAEHTPLASGFPVEMPPPTQSSFMDALLANAIPSLDSHDGKMLTENGDIAFRTSGSALVDAFYELETVISGARLKECLENAWAENPEATLRIIWNARSIHLGKGSRNTFYRAVGWLAEKHPQTLLANLPWLVRPLIMKKVAKKDEKKEDVAKEVKGVEEKSASATTDEVATKEEIQENVVMVTEADDDSDFDLVDEEMGDENAATEKKPKQAIADSLEEFDVKYGLAHGYWKDLLNILSLAANDQLKADGDPRSVFNIDNRKTEKRSRDWTKGLKGTRVAAQHKKVAEKLESDEFYKSLHTTVAGLFAEQLKLDTARLKSGSKADKKRITLAAKWAPSAGESHDNQTFIVSTIAELLHSFEDSCPDSVDPGDRKQYLKHARIAYRSKTVSPLRKFLRVVERDITAEKFENIMYERVASLAMKQYTALFIRKDQERFEEYIDGVADGKMRISGATLLPSTLVAATSGPKHAGGTGRNAYVNQRVKEREFEIMQKTLDGQWKTLVQRIKGSGTLESSIAVCDVSGSMSGPVFPDGTCPMDSAIGLSLLLAEVTAAPFGGAMITFSSTPTVIRVGGTDDHRTLAEKVSAIRRAEWGMSTDFVAVFERLLLPMATEHKVKKEDMVKQVFVFSDMQFNAADAANDYYGYSRRSSDKQNESWASSYERIKARFAEAGYDMPRLIFWNLAGGRAGMIEGSVGDDTAPKPVQAHEENTALVSGYSQGQMKMFLENGGFEDPEADEEIKETVDEDGDVVVEKVKGKQDPLAVVKKAVCHDAYRMLRVVD